MKVCFISNRIFKYGIYDGYGMLTYQIAKGLVERGIEVFVVMQRLLGQPAFEKIEGIKVYSFPLGKYNLWKSQLLFKKIDADIYHSQEPSLRTFLAQRAMPHRKHIITFQDPQTLKEQKTIAKIEGRRLSLYFYLRNIALDYFIKKAVHNSDYVAVQTNYIKNKVVKMYGLRNQPDFLPNPVKIPFKTTIQKDSYPTVCFLARWDSVKRPEIFFELAKLNPNIQFIAMGKAHSQHRNKELRKRYENIKNLTLTGFVPEQEKVKVLSKSWILVNTSKRECLPISFLEACAHKCAILSYNNPDNFAGNFGYHVKGNSLEELNEGLRMLLEGNKWRVLGENGFEYVAKNHSFDKVIEKHIKIYREICQS